jgi:thiamine biosynthesis lipoprotein
MSAAAPDPRRRRFLQILGAATLVSGYAFVRVRHPDEVLEFRGIAMGSLYTVRVAGAGLSALGQAAVRDAVASALASVDASMSTFRPDSELSRFNAHASDAPFALSAETFGVLALAHRASEATAGAFDVTVAPAVDAWGFGPGRRERIVGDDEVAALRPRIGWRMLSLDAGARTVAKARPEVRADLSGIAKGYAVDKAARALDALGVGNYVIEAGGEVRASGHNGAGEPWRIGIEEPDAMPRRPRYVVPVSGASVATSGDYRIYFERDGRRYSHEIDPATGRPTASRLASVSVVMPDCAHADALAKLIVLGPERAHALATACGLATYFVVRERDGTLRDVATPAFAALGGGRYRPAQNTG